jgi:CRISPR system Cascade subunit CasB
VAQQMGELKGKKPLVNQLRFRRILETEQPEELFQILVRALPLLGNAVNLLDLSDSVYRWNDKNNDKRKRWALEYYSTLSEKVSKS